MTSTIKLYLLLIYYIASCNARHGEIISKEDRPYDVIDIKVPRTVWNQALHPTPVLKSPVTIVVPVHVAQEDNEVEDEIDDDINEEENEVINPVVNDEVVTEVASSTPVTPAVTEVTQAPVVQDQPAQPQPPQEVSGQVTRFPCSCLNGQCGCCTGAILERFRMKACGNMSFVPEDFVFDVRLSVNNNTVIRRRVSASDPPPICFNPRRAPFVRICAEISNISIRNRNAFACLDINADIGGFQVYSASFRCFGLGASGVQTGLKPKPVSTGPKPVSLFGNGESEDDGGGFLDGVAGGILGGGDSDGGLFGGGGGGDDDGGPLDAIGDVVGDFFEER